MGLSAGWATSESSISALGVRVIDSRLGLYVTWVGVLLAHFADNQVDDLESFIIPPVTTIVFLIL
jgi:hypothetical protein